MKRKQAVYGLLFMVPGLIGFLLFVLIPVLFTVWYAGIDGGGKFHLFGNFVSLFQSEAFLHALKNTAFYLVIGSALSLTLAVAIALMLFRLIQRYPKLAANLRTCYLIPLVIPSGVCVLFAHILFSDGGFVNRLTGSEIDFLRTAPYTFWILVLIYAYKNTGYYIVILLMAFGGIKPEVYDAAKCDGAGVFTTLFRIMIPQITPSAFFLLIISIVNVFKMNRESYLLFGDYPNDSSYMFQNFIKNNLGNLNYSRAAAACLFLLVLFSFLVYFLLNLSEKEGGSDD